MSVKAILVRISAKFNRFKKEVLPKQTQPISKCRVRPTLKPAIKCSIEKLIVPGIGILQCCCSACRHNL